MDVIVTENLNQQRRFRVNGVSSVKEAIEKVSGLAEGTAELPSGITREDQGENENYTYSTQAAPPRPANPTTQ